MDAVGLEPEIHQNHNRWVKSVIDGKSVWVIVNGKIQTDECMKNGISARPHVQTPRRRHLRNLCRQTRRDGTNGQLAVIKYGDESLRYPLITDGQVDPDILEIIKRDEEWLQQELDRLRLEASQSLYRRIHRRKIGGTPLSFLI